MMQKPSRPIGITFLAIIQILIGVLGFLVSLARELAEKQGAGETANTLAALEHELEDARLAKVDALSRRLTQAERRYFQDHRSPTARHWNLLTGLSADTLQYAE